MKYMSVSSSIQGRRSDGETINQKLATLRKLPDQCNFGDKINKHLRDRLVVGVKDEKIQRRLLS